MSDQNLADEVAALREQVALLRQVLDEVLVELTWANDNARDLPAGTEKRDDRHRRRCRHCDLVLAHWRGEEDKA